MSGDRSAEGDRGAGDGRLEIRRVALVVNPAAGAGGSADIAGRAAARLARRGVETRVIAGDSPDHARELIRGIERDREVDAVVVCGGDGMVSLVVQEIAFISFSTTQWPTTFRLSTFLSLNTLNCRRIFQL